MLLDWGCCSSAVAWRLLSVLCHMGLSSISCFIKASESIKQEIECQIERENVIVLSKWASERMLSNKSQFFFLNKYLWKWWASLVAQTVNNPPAMQETWLWSMGYKSPLEEEVSTHSSKFQGQRNLMGYSPWCRKELDMTEWLMLSLSLWKWHPNLEITKEKSDLFDYVRIINEMNICHKMEKIFSTIYKKKENNQNRNK